MCNSTQAGYQTCATQEGYESYRQIGKIQTNKVNLVDSWLELVNNDLKLEDPPHIPQCAICSIRDNISIIIITPNLLWQHLVLVELIQPLEYLILSVIVATG